MALVREMNVGGAIVRIWDDCYANQSEDERRAIKRNQQRVAYDIVARAVRQNPNLVIDKQAYDLPPVTVTYDRDHPERVGQTIG